MRPGHSATIGLFTLRGFSHYKAIRGFSGGFGFKSWLGLGFSRLNSSDQQSYWLSVHMIVFVFSSNFAFFSNSCVFSTTPPHFSPTFPIPRAARDLERVLYSAHTYTLSGCTNVPTNRPIRAALQRRCCGVGALCTAKKGGRGRGVSSCLQRHEGGMRAV